MRTVHFGVQVNASKCNLLKQTLNKSHIFMLRIAAGRYQQRVAQTREKASAIMLRLYSIKKKSPYGFVIRVSSLQFCSRDYQKQIKNKVNAKCTKVIKIQEFPS